MRITPHGRYTTKHNELKFYNTGSGVSFSLFNNKVSFEIESKNNAGFIYIIHDFDYEHKEKVFIENKKRFDFSFIDNQIHNIDLIKANEAIDNYLIIKLISNNNESIEIEESNKKFVKVYGDSTIAGYGILSHDGEANIFTNDGVEDFCFRSLYSLGFDYDIFAASGWGLTFSIYTCPMTVGIENFQDKICVNSNINWNGKSPDLLIISLGTNDFSFIQANDQNSEDLTIKFIKSYENFIKKEREKNPEIPVLMLYGSVKEENVYPLIKKTYSELSKKLKNIHLLKLSGDNSGLSNHSFYTFHKKMSEELSQKLKKLI